MTSCPAAEALLLDGPAGSDYGGSGKPFLWEVARNAALPVVLAGGLAADNVGVAIAAALLGHAHATDFAAHAAPIRHMLMPTRP